MHVSDLTPTPTRRLRLQQPETTVAATLAARRRHHLADGTHRTYVTIPDGVRNDATAVTYQTARLIDHVERVAARYFA